MKRLIFGDNQFFSVNHISEEKSRSLTIKFKEDKTILNTIDIAIENGISTFMCTTHDRMSNICHLIRQEPDKYSNFSIYPCMPYAHKYANAVTELGLMGTIKNYLPGNIIGSMIKGGIAVVSKDYISIMELMIDAEMKMFTKINTPVIFLQNIVTDLLLGLGMKDIFKAYHDYIIKKYNAEPGFITMNLPKLAFTLNQVGIKKPIICSSINKAGFRMSGGIELYHQTLMSNTVRAMAMQVMGGGAIPPQEALKYICELPNIESILFGASSRQNISQTVSLIKNFDHLNNKTKVYENYNCSGSKTEFHENCTLN